MPTADLRHVSPSPPDRVQFSPAAAASLVSPGPATGPTPSPRGPALGLALLCRYTLTPPYPLLSKRTIPCPLLAPVLDDLPYRGTSEGVAIYSNLEPMGGGGEAE